MEQCQPHRKYYLQFGCGGGSLFCYFVYLFF